MKTELKKINKYTCFHVVETCVHSNGGGFYFIVIVRGGEMKSEESKKVWQPHFGATKVRYRYFFFF